MRKPMMTTVALLWVALSLTCQAMEWTASGDGVRTENPLGFAQRGEEPYAVRARDLETSNYFLSGEVLLPAAGASLVVAIGETVPNAATKEQPSARIQFDKGGKLQMTRQDLNHDNMPDIPNTWTRFYARLIGGQAELRFDTPGARSVHAAVALGTHGVTLTLHSGARLRDLDLRIFPNLPKLMQPVCLDRCANVKIAGPDADSALGPALDPASLPQGAQVIDGVPFCFVRSADGQALDVSRIKRDKLVRDAKDAKGRFGGFACEVAGDQYAGIHLIAFASKRSGGAPRAAVRLGFTDGGADEWSDAVVTVPAVDAVNAEGVVSRVPVKLADGRAGSLYHLRVPLDGSGNLAEYPDLGVEFTRDVRVPEQAFLEQTVDPPSGVVILAATLERSPIVMSWTTDELCGIFSDTQKVVFKLQLANRSDQPVAGRATARCRGPGLPEEQISGRRDWTVTQSFTLPPGRTIVVPLDVTPEQRGWYACAIAVEAGRQIVQTRDTSFAVLAPDTRQAMGDSPFGAWCFWESHTTTDNPQRDDKLGSLMRKAGIRWTYGGKPSGAGSKEFNAEVFRRMHDRYKLTWTIQPPPGSYGRSKKDMPKGAYYDEGEFKETVPPWLAQARQCGFDPYYKVLHESRSSMALLRRFSEFLGGTPYDMPADEKTKLELQFKDTVKYCHSLKQADPEAKICFINDYPAFVGEYLKRKFPAELFDVIGLESAMFHRQPERQPDWLCLLGTLHQMKRMQRAFGYDKPVWFTEALYHSTKPGTLGLHDQACIIVREAMLALANGVQRMAAANTVADCSDDYAKSNWGTAGLCFRDPEYNPKPGYAMYAWMTQVLDQTHFQKKLDPGSTSLHALDFQRPDGGHVCALWVVRGWQRVQLKVSAGTPTVWDAYGNKLAPASSEGGLTVEVSDAPVYVTGVEVTGIAQRQSVEVPAQGGKLVLKLLDAGQIKVMETNSPLLEQTNTPANIKGRFAFPFVTEDNTPAMKIELLKDDDPRKLVPRYVVFQLTPPAPLPEARPYALDLRLKGNGGWGRVMVELTDAGGQTWTACADGTMENLGRSYVNFDGWQTLRLHLPGNYPGTDQALRWPVNSDWYCSGSEPIKYPLQLTQIIVTMRPHILYVDEERSPASHAIYLDRLSVVPAPEGM